METATIVGFIVIGAAVFVLPAITLGFLWSLRRGIENRLDTLGTRLGSVETRLGIVEGQLSVVVPKLAVQEKGRE